VPSGGRIALCNFRKTQFTFLREGPAWEDGRAIVAARVEGPYPASGRRRSVFACSFVSPVAGAMPAQRSSPGEAAARVKLRAWFKCRSLSILMLAGCLLPNAIHAAGPCDTTIASLVSWLNQNPRCPA
jgi:hypothetical protein